MTLSLCFACVLAVFVGVAATAAPPPRWDAVLVAGDLAEPVFDNAVAAFSRFLASRGVAPGNIHRLSARPNPPRPEIEPASETQLLRRIALMAQRPGDRCLVFLTSHGHPEAGFVLAYSGEMLQPAALAHALAVGCGAAPTVVIVSSCFSGIFAAGPMLAPNRIVLTAARPDRPSFGCQADRTYTVFDECLLGALPRARLWREVFAATNECVRRREREMGVQPSEPRAFFGAAVRDLAVP